VKHLVPALILGACTALGLLAALLGGEGWHAVSWVALGVPIVVIVEGFVRGVRRRDS